MIASKERYLICDTRVGGELRKRLIVKVPTAERGGFLQAGLGWVPTIEFGEDVLFLETQLRDGTWRYPRDLFSDEELEAAGYTVQRITPKYAISAPLLGASEKIEARNDTQRNAIAAIEGKSGHLILAPGKGKTVMALKSCADEGHPFIVFVHDGGLLQQWKDRIDEFLGYRCTVVTCRGPFDKWGDWERAHVAVCTFQSFHSQMQKGKVSQEFLERWGTAVFDEAHHVKAATFSTAIHAFPGRRLALTATPDQGGFEKIAYAHIGPILFEDLESDLYPTFHYVPVRLPTNHPAQKIARGATALEQVRDLVLGTPSKHPCPVYFKRVVEVVEDCLLRGHNVIFLANRLNFAYLLKDHFAEQFPDTEVIDGSVPFKERTKLLKQSQLTIVSQRIGEEGLDRSDLSVTITPFPYGSGVSGRNKLSQGGGRSLRSHDGKLPPEVYVIGPNVPGLINSRAVNEKHAKDLGYTVSHEAVLKTAEPGLADAIRKSSVQKEHKTVEAPKPSRFSGLASMIRRSNE